MPAVLSETLSPHTRCIFRYTQKKPGLDRMHKKPREDTSLCVQSASKISSIPCRGIKTQKKQSSKPRNTSMRYRTLKPSRDSPKCQVYSSTYSNHVHPFMSDAQTDALLSLVFGEDPGGRDWCSFLLRQLHHKIIDNFDLVVVEYRLG